jgi:hypothetical protein
MPVGDERLGGERQGRPGSWLTRIRGRTQPQDRLPPVLQEAHRKGVQGGRLRLLVLWGCRWNTLGSMRRLRAAEEEWSTLCLRANVCYAAMWLGLEHMVLPAGPMWTHTYTTLSSSAVVSVLVQLLVFMCCSSCSCWCCYGILTTGRKSLSQRINGWQPNTHSSPLNGPALPTNQPVEFPSRALELSLWATKRNALIGFCIVPCDPDRPAPREPKKACRLPIAPYVYRCLFKKENMKLIVFYFLRGKLIVLE